MKKIIALILMAAIAFGLPVYVFASDAGKPGQPVVISSACHVAGFVDQAGCLWMCGSTSDFPISVEGDLQSAYGAPIQSTPIKVMDHVRSVSFGYLFYGIIKDDGTLWMWGRTDDGVIGNDYGYDTATETNWGTAYSQASPVQILDHVTALSCGTCSAAAIRDDGSLWMWGEVSRIGHGVTGTGKDTNMDHWPVQTVPIQIMTDVNAVSCGSNITAVIKTDGSLWAWHYIDSNEQGYVVHTASEPVKLLDGVASVSCGYDFLTALKNDGTLWTYGSNSFGMLGSRDAESFGAPVKIMDNVVQACAGDRSGAAVCSDGTLWTWGDNTLCALGNGEFVSSGMLVTEEQYKTIPGKILENVCYVNMNYGHGYVLSNDGSMWVWGCNSAGELGNGFQGDYSVWANGDREHSSPFQSSPVKTPKAFMIASDPIPADASADTVKVMVNGFYVEWPDAEPFIDENSRTMVPLRAVANAMKLSVTWEAYARVASFSDGTKTIRFPIDSCQALTDDGSMIEMDTAAVIVNDRTYAPVRYLAEFFGYSVDWDGETRTVIMEEAG